MVTTIQAIGTVTRVEGNKEGDGKVSKSDGNGKEEGDGEKKGNGNGDNMGDGNGNKGGGQLRGHWEKRTIN
jgi:hypothetical protein